LEAEVKEVMKLPEFHAVTRGKVAVEELLPSFHFIDFDNNGTLDLFFEGKILNVFHVFVFFKRNDSYVVSIGEKGSIVSANLPREDNGLCFSIWKEGCCGDNINTFTQYVCISTCNTSYFNVASKSLTYRRTILPPTRIAKPVAFKIPKVGFVRIEPLVDDEKQIGGKSSWKGNAVGMYPPNSTGTIYAETKDNRGEFWYFVRMNNETEIRSRIHSNRFVTDEAKMFSGDENLEDYFIYGWIHSSEVSIIGEE
jgi:hypothetical protein